MDILQSIFVGVLSGVFTSILLFLAASYTNKVIVPWYRSISYRGLDISGQWKEQYEEAGSVVDVSIFIKQKAHDISGQIIFSRRSDDGEGTKSMSFNLIGTFFEGYLAATARNINNKRVGIASYLLRVESEGTKMAGKSSWFDPLNDEIRSASTIWSLSTTNDSFYRDLNNSEHTKNS